MMTMVNTGLKGLNNYIRDLRNISYYSLFNHERSTIWHYSYVSRLDDLRLMMHCILVMWSRSRQLISIHSGSKWQTDRRQTLSWQRSLVTLQWRIVRRIERGRGWSGGSWPPPPLSKTNMPKYHYFTLFDTVFLSVKLRQYHNRLTVSSPYLLLLLLLF